MSHEAVRAACDAIAADVETRIAAGEIPPRPESFADGAHAAWFDEHLRCETSAHRYSIRVRGSRRCSACLAARVAA